MSSCLTSWICLFYSLRLHYKKTRLLRQKIARENFPCKFATSLQQNSKKNKILANLSHFCDENFSLQICKRFAREVMNFSQIPCKFARKHFSGKFASDLQEFYLSILFSPNYLKNLQWICKEQAWYVHFITFSHKMK